MSYCVDPLGEYSQNLCRDSYGGGGRHAIWFPNYLPVDPSDGVEIQGMIDEGEAILVKDIKIGIPEPSAVTRTSYVSCEADPTVNYDRTLTYIDQNVIDENVDFYNTLKRRISVAGIMIYECDADRVTLINSDISVSGGRILPDDNTDSQTFTLTGSWRSRDDANIYETPANIF